MNKSFTSFYPMLFRANIHNSRQVVRFQEMERLQVLPLHAEGFSLESIDSLDCAMEDQIK